MADEYRETILIVDDNPINLRMLLLTLRRDNYQVIEARNAAEALALLELTRPDIILLDVIMPDMDGYELCRRLKADPRTTDIPVIFLTGLTEAEDEARGLEAGAVDYINKPFRTATVLARVKTQLRLAGVQRDLREKNEALRLGEERFRTLANFTFDWEEWIRPDGGYEYVSPSCERITGYRAEEFLAGPALTWRIVHPDSRDLYLLHLKSVRNVAAPAERIEFKILTRDGKTVCIDHVCQPVFSADGRYLGRRTSNRDVTRQREMSLELEHVRRQESIHAIAGAIAHRFNNSMMAVLGSLEIISLHIPPEADCYGLLQTAKQASLEASKVGTIMLAFTGQAKVRSRPGDLALPVLNAVKAQRKKLPANVALEFEPPTSLLPCSIDGERITEVVSSLLDNAVEAIGEGPGRILVCCGRERRRTSSLPLFFRKEDEDELRDFVLCRIEDNGHGMDPATQSRIFDPFFTTRFVGRGLGLTETAGVVRAHNGAILTESEPGAGAIMTLLLPLGNNGGGRG